MRRNMRGDTYMGIYAVIQYEEETVGPIRKGKTYLMFVN